MKSKAEQQSGRAKHKSRDEEQSMNFMKLVIPSHFILRNKTQNDAVHNE